MVVDATGLRVYGSGEWHVRKHRHGRHRAWRKLHLGVDERTKEIVAVEVTPSRVHDCRLLPALLDQIPGRIVQVSGDGAYPGLFINRDRVLKKDSRSGSTRKLAGCGSRICEEYRLARRLSGWGSELQTDLGLDECGQRLLGSW